MEAQTVPTSARYIDKSTTVGTCSASMENEATRTHRPTFFSPLPLPHFLILHLCRQHRCVIAPSQPAVPWEMLLLHTWQRYVHFCRGRTRTGRWNEGPIWRNQNTSIWAELEKGKYVESKQSWIISSVKGQRAVNNKRSDFRNKWKQKPVWSLMRSGVEGRGAFKTQS